LEISLHNLSILSSCLYLIQDFCMASLTLRQWSYGLSLGPFQGDGADGLHRANRPSGCSRYFSKQDRVGRGDCGWKHHAMHQRDGLRVIQQEG
jgi:hypothetical protein